MKIDAYPKSKKYLILCDDREMTFWFLTLLRSNKTLLDAQKDALDAEDLELIQAYDKEITKTFDVYMQLKDVVDKQEEKLK